MPHWITSWPLGPVAAAAVVFAVAAAVVGGYAVQFRRVGVARRSAAPSRWSAASLLGLRLLAVGSLLWMFSDAAYQSYLVRPAAIWVCVDRSASMLASEAAGDAADDDAAGDASASGGNGAGRRTRFERAAEAAEGLAEAWRAQHADALEQSGGEVRYFLLGESVREADAAAVRSLAGAAAELRRASGGGTDFERIGLAVGEGGVTGGREGTAGRFAASSPLGDSLGSLQPLAAIERPAAVVVISDGNATGGLPLESILLGAPQAGAGRVGGRSGDDVAVPVFTLAAGDEGATRRLAIAGVTRPSLVFADDPVALGVRVETRGLAGRRVRVELRGEGDAVPLAVETIEADAAGAAEVRLEAVAPQTDRWPLRVVAELEETGSAAGGGERSGAGGRLRAEERLEVPVRSEPVRVLLIAESYGYETRFLKHLLERTKQRGNPEAAVFEPTFCIDAAQPPLVQTDPQLIEFLPIDEAWWERFEVCVVIDPAADRFDPALAEAVERAARRQGCGVIFVAGKLHAAEPLSAPPWRSLLPVEAGGDTAAGGPAVGRAEVARAGGESATPVRCRWTEAARVRGGWDATLEIFEGAGGESVPALLWHGEAARPKPTASALAVAEPLGGSDPRSGGSDLGPGAVLLAEHIVGAGRVAYVGSDELYRWRTFMGSERLYLQFYSDLFASVVKRPGAAARPTVRVELSAERFAAGGRVRVAAEVTGEGAAGLFGETLAIRLIGETGPAGGPYPEAGGSLLLRRAGEARYEVALEGLPPGGYRIAAAEGWEGLAGLAGRLAFHVEPPPGELAALEPKPASLRTLAERSGGRSEPLGRWRELAAALPPPHALQFEPLPPKSVWNSPWLVGLIVAALSAEWYLRNRWGLL